MRGTGDIAFKALLDEMTVMADRLMGKYASHQPLGRTR
jgi:hypothetical protein